MSNVFDELIRRLNTAEKTSQSSRIYQCNPQKLKRIKTETEKHRTEYPTTVEL